MTIRPRNGSFQVDVRVNGVRIREDFPTLAQAEAREAELLERARSVTSTAKPVPKAIREREAQAVTQTRVREFGELVRFVIEKKWQHAASCRTSEINIGFALRFFGDDFPINGFDKDAVDSYAAFLAERGDSNGTINRKLTALNVCLGFAQKYGWLASAPDMERKAETGYRDRVITYQEEALALAYFERIGRDDLADLFIVLLETGLRAGVEALRLQVSSVSRVPFPAVTVVGKRAKKRTVPLTDRAIAAIDRRVQAATLRGQQRLWKMSYRTFLERWDGMAAALGLGADPAFIPHACRHTCASRLADALVPAQQIQKWLGHTRIETTMKYVHASAASLEVGVRALQALRPQPAADNVTTLPQEGWSHGHKRSQTA